VAEFQRARSEEAKQQREAAILAAATLLATDRGVRAVTLTDIADAVGLHKSAMLRYFETREQLFLRLAADGWRAWGADVDAALGRRMSADKVAAALTDTLVRRPLFCDLLAQVPLNLERNVSYQAVRLFKLTTAEEVSRISDALDRSLGLTREQSVDVIATATYLAGALWQVSTPPPVVQELYRNEPVVAHTVIEVRPRLTRILAALLRGLR
jgi:AcrR family transcriptional regulator